MEALVKKSIPVTLTLRCTHCGASRTVKPEEADAGTALDCGDCGEWLASPEQLQEKLARQAASIMGDGLWEKLRQLRMSQLEHAG